MKFWNKKKSDTRGQAAIEFMVVVIVVFFFLFFFLSISILIVTSEYLEFATFMAARTYKSGFGSQQFQEQHAREVFNAYVSNVSGIAKNINLQFVDGFNGNQTAGVLTTYSMDMFYMPPIFVRNGVPPSRITLQTESHLGRDPAADECRNFFDQFVRQFNLGIDQTTLVEQMDDNGC